jgi:hypothetical protein
MTRQDRTRRARTGRVDWAALRGRSAFLALALPSGSNLTTGSLMSAGAKIQGLPPAELREAVEALWRVLVPGPENLLKLFEVPEFVRLRDACVRLYPKAHSEESSGVMDFALSDALQALGLPGRPPPADRHLALPAGIAAARLQAAFERTEARRVYLCPLDEAGDLPDLRFGPNRIVRLTAPKLEELVDQPRLRRINPAWTFDAKRFSEFACMVSNRANLSFGRDAGRKRAGRASDQTLGLAPADRTAPTALSRRCRERGVRDTIGPVGRLDGDGYGAGRLAAF